MVDPISPRNPLQSRNTGSVVLAVVPFVAVALVFFELPLWLDIFALAGMVAMVGMGATLVRRRSDGWRPSETLTKPSDIDS